MYVHAFIGGEMLDPVEIKKDVYWVGGIDWNARYFHGYTTEMGITYNAYLIVDEKVVLVDTTKKPFASDLIDRISNIVDPSKIDYIISNHVEMDHSGAIPEIMKLAPNATIVTSSPQGLKGLTAHYGDKYNYLGVKTGDTLNIGKRTLSFVQTPMVHWPDNMVTYDEFDKILFSNDAFGQHIATSARSDSKNDFEEVMYQAKKYYANIVQPYSMQAGRAVAAVKKLDLDYICPSHGVIWKDHIEDILDAYTTWTNKEVKEKAIVVYDSMWSTTAKMARAIAEGFVNDNIEVHLYDLKVNHPSDVMCEFLESKYVCVGSPTLNSQMLPNVAAFLTYMKGLSPKNENRIGIAFGSYGWAPIGPKNVEAELESVGFNIPIPVLKNQWLVDDENLNNIKKLVSSCVKGDTED